MIWRIIVNMLYAWIWLQVKRIFILAHADECLCWAYEKKHSCMIYKHGNRHDEWHFVGFEWKWGKSECMEYVKWNLIEKFSVGCKLWSEAVDDYYWLVAWDAICFCGSAFWWHNVLLHFYLKTAKSTQTELHFPFVCSSMKWFFFKTAKIDIKLFDQQAHY